MRTRLGWLALTAGALLFASRSAIGQAQGIVSVRHYELDVDMDYDAERLDGVATIVVGNPNDHPVGQISLLLYRLLHVATVHGGEHELEFTQDVVVFGDFAKLQVNHVVVTLRDPLPPDGETTIRVEYGGHLLGYAETGMRYIRDHIDREFTILRNDGRAFPLPGYPLLAALRSAVLPSFTYLARITVPEGLTVANGGHLVARDGNDDRITFTYASLEPSWRMDFAIANYELLTEGPLRIFHLEGDEEGAQAVARVARRALDLYGSWFGALRRETTLAFIEIPDGWGSQTDVTAILQTAPAFRDPTRHREVYHELSHLWSVPATDRPSPRLEEGLASFLEYLVTEEVTGEPVVHRRANELVDWLRRELPTHPEWARVPLVAFGRAGLTDLSYRVGALLFDLFYRIVGLREFTDAIGRFYQRFAATGATTEDFVRALSESSRNDLDRLFEDWIYTPRWTGRIADSHTVDDLVQYYRQ